MERSASPLLTLVLKRARFALHRLAAAASPQPVPVPAAVKTP
ncbi:hypothetical protein AB0G79_14805 [Streptomyces sp. NPDC020807]